MIFILDEALITEAQELYNNLEVAKSAVEKEINKAYDDMNEAERKIFISNVLKRMNNYKKILSRAEPSIIKAILDSNWQNKDFNKYVNHLDDEQIFDDQILELVYNLFKAGNLDFNRDTWLGDPQVYARNPSDVLYTIKALTFASDKNLQEKDGRNKYFDKPLEVSDLYKAGRLESAARIKDIINSKQTKGFNSSVNDFKRDTRISKDAQVVKDIEKVTKEEIRKSLRQIGRYDDRAEEVINKLYDADKGDTDFATNVYNALGLNVSVRA